MTLPFPDKVDVALQKKWFSQGRIQLIKAVQPLSLLMLVKTLWISEDKSIAKLYIVYSYIYVQTRLKDISL